MEPEGGSRVTATARHHDSRYTANKDILQNPSLTTTDSVGLNFSNILEKLIAEQKVQQQLLEYCVQCTVYSVPCSFLQQNTGNFLLLIPCLYTCIFYRKIWKTRMYTRVE